MLPDRWTWRPGLADVLLVVVPILLTGGVGAATALALEVDAAGVAAVVPVAVFAAVGSALPLLWARAAPMSAIGALSAVSCLLTVLTRPQFEAASAPSGDGPGTVVVAVSAAVSFTTAVPALYLVARRGRRALLVALPLYAVPGVLVTQAYNGTSLLSTLGLAVLLTLGVGLVYCPAWVLGLRHHARDLRAAERARRQAEFAERAVRDERTRIMRELQDLVLTDLARIEEQAQATHRALDAGTAAAPSRDEVHRALASISGSGRDALGSMRRLLGMLRSTGDGAIRAPQPTLDGLDGLVDGFRRAGLDVDLAVSGERHPLPAEVDLAAYRLLQRVLAGSGRDGSVHLRVDYTDRGLRLGADGDIGDVGGVTVREWVRLVGGEMRAATPRSIDVWLPGQVRGAR